LVRRVERVLAAAFACVALASGVGVADSAAPTVAACANPSLPAEILDGVTRPVAPLPLAAVRAPGADLEVAVAADARSRERGLMCVTRLRRHRGMAFVFPHAGEWEFWMKDTLIPLDMIWIDGSTVTRIEHDVPASHRGAADATIARRRGYGSIVIELQAGEAAADKITMGAQLAMPPFTAQP
jgi:uncharacterized membrane protein (UPF0127 family)